MKAFICISILSFMLLGEANGQKHFDIQSYNIIDTVGPYKTPLHFVAFSPDAKYVAGAGDDYKVIIWRADSNKVYKALKGHKGRVNSVAYSTNGNYLASASSDGTVILWEVATGKALKTFTPEGIPMGQGKKITFVCFGKDDKEILFGGEDNKVTRIHNPLTTAASSLAASSAGPIAAGVYSPNKKWFAFCSNSLIYVLNTTTDELKVIAGSSDAVTSLAFNPDNKILAAKCKDRYIEFWNLRTSVKVKSIKPEYDNKDEDYTRIQYSPNGKYLATGSIDNSPQMWDVDDYKVLYHLRGHTAPARSLDFSRDGRLLATAGEDSTIRIWYLAEAVLLDEENKKLQQNTVTDKGKKPHSADSAKLANNVRYSDTKVPMTLNGRRVVASKPVEVKSPQVSLYVWDDDQVDGDIISLNFNGKWVLSSYKLTKKKKVVNIKLDENGNNFLLVYAHNEGDTPPNTAGISIYDGYSETKLILKSDLKSCDAVRLIIK